MDALQVNDVHQPDGITLTRFIMICVFGMVFFVPLPGLLVGFVVCVIAAIGPLSGSEAWNQFGWIVAVVVSGVSFAVIAMFLVYGITTYRPLRRE